jgi:hypothetical protein
MIRGRGTVKSQTKTDFRLRYGPRKSHALNRGFGRRVGQKRFVQNLKAADVNFMKCCDPCKAVAN